MRGGLSASHVADSGLCDKVVIAFKQETSGHIHDTQVNTHTLACTVYTDKLQMSSCRDKLLLHAMEALGVTSKVFTLLLLTTLK